LTEIPIWLMLMKKIVLAVLFATVFALYLVILLKEILALVNGFCGMRD